MFVENNSSTTKKYKNISIFLIGLIYVFANFFMYGSKVFAACTAPTTDYGTATQTINISTTGTYRVWSRIKAPDATNNSYLLEVDGGTCVTVGDSAIPANTWTWVDYQSGNSATKTNLSLTAGNHTFKLIGREPGVGVDKLVFTTDTTCTPIGDGTNCSNPPDTTLPTVSLTSPTAGVTVSGFVNLAATASDDVGVTRVEFLVDNVLVNSDTSSPYAYSWDSRTTSDGSRVLTAKAYDGAGNTRTSASVTVTVSNVITPPPPVTGDINGDGVVNVFDLSILASNFGKSGMTRAQGDLNSDTVVNVFDLSILAGNWSN